MKGQWIGNYQGTNSGEVIIEIDERDDCFEGVAYLYDQHKNLPASFVPFKTKDKSTSFTMQVQIGPIDPATGNLTDWNSIEKKIPDVVYPVSAETNWRLTPNSLDISWITNINTSGQMSLPKSNAQSKSEITPLDISSWKDFKEYATKFEPYAELLPVSRTLS